MAEVAVDVGVFADVDLSERLPLRVHRHTTSTTDLLGVPGTVAAYPFRGPCVATKRAKIAILRTPDRSNAHS